MKVEYQTVGTVEVCKPVGALVDDDAQRFTEHLLTRANRTNSRFVISLHDVPYMDSQALEGLLNASDALHGQSDRLKLVSVAPTCREILEITGLASSFQFFENIEDAVRSFL